MKGEQKIHKNSESSTRETVRTALISLQKGLRQIYGSQAPVLLVYGSYARGDEITTSDVDVLLMYSKSIKPGQEIKRVSSLLAELNLRYQVLISILPVEEKQYRSADSIFWHILRNEGVPIEQI